MLCAFSQRGMERDEDMDDDNENDTSSRQPHSPPELYSGNARQLAKVNRPKPVATSERFMQCNQLQSSLVHSIICAVCVSMLLIGSYVTWKFFIHIAVVIAVTAQVMTVIRRHRHYRFAMQ
jgi:hypothetical protein